MSDLLGSQRIIPKEDLSSPVLEQPKVSPICREFQQPDSLVSPTPGQIQGAEPLQS